MIRFFFVESELSQNIIIAMQRKKNVRKIRRNSNKCRKIEKAKKKNEVKH